MIHRFTFDDFGTMTVVSIYEIHSITQKKKGYLQKNVLIKVNFIIIIDNR
jgi:hypothetical protein